MNIYKYMHENRIKNILIDNKIRFTQPIYLNDPFEVKIAINGFAHKSEIVNLHKESFNDNIRELYNNDFAYLKSKISFEEFSLLLNEEENLDVLLKIINSDILHCHFMKEFNNKISKEIGVLSLTTEKDNLLMWGHYSNNHKGFVVEFNKNDSFFNELVEENAIYNCLKKVEYQSIRPSKYLSDYCIEDVLLTKSIHWEYEHEYRILKRLKEALIEDINLENDIYLFRFQKVAIKSIYCGCNMDINIKNKILSIIDNDRDLNHVKVFISSISDKYYKLEFEQIR